MEQWIRYIVAITVVLLTAGCLRLYQWWRELHAGGSSLPFIRNLGAQREDEARYCRLFLLVMNISSITLRRVINNFHLKQGIPSFEAFLDNQKDKLFHLAFKRCCCANVSNKTPMFRSQWDQLFTKTGTAPPHRHHRGDCPCQYKAVPGVVCEVMDITLSCFIIRNLCPGVNMMDVETIRTERINLIYANSCSLDEVTFNARWTCLQAAILSLASSVSPQVEADTRTMLHELKHRFMNNADLMIFRDLIVDTEQLEDVGDTRVDVTALRLRTDRKSTSAEFTVLKKTADTKTEVTALQHEQKEKIVGVTTTSERVKELESDTAKMSSTVDALESMLRKAGFGYERVWVVGKFSEKIKTPLFVVETTGEVEGSVDIEAFKRDLHMDVEFVKIEREESRILARKDMSILHEFNTELVAEAHTAVEMHANTILNSHSNAVFLDVSGFKSKSFGTEYAKCTKELTIVIYTRIKGYIPLGENGFPEYIEGFKTDIRHGMVLAATKSFEFHDHLRLGCSISSKAQFSCTLGPFFYHPVTKQICSWTCAHGLISPASLNQHGIDRVNEVLKNTSVFQPCERSSNEPIGVVISAAIHEGRVTNEMAVSGVDGAIIELRHRLPSDGYFPFDDNRKIDAAGLDSNPKYDSGRIEKDVSKIKDKVLIMYGKESGFQRGTACLSTQKIKSIPVQVSFGQLSYKLHQQIKVMPIPSENENCRMAYSDFAKKGDSGAPVFISEHDELVAVGMLCAITDFGPAFVTPIEAFLQAFNLDDVKEMLKFRTDGSIEAVQRGNEIVPVTSNPETFNLNYNIGAMEVE